jgi:type IV secretory pathway VirB6-like protein
MLFYGKEIDFTLIILIVILILAAYILYSYYQQQKQSIPIIVDSHSTITSTTVAIPEKTQLKNGAFAISLWIKFNSSIPSSISSFNLLRLTKETGTATPLSLTLDASGNLVVTTTTAKTNIILFPIEEAVNVVLNYNGDDDIDPDKDETVYDPTTNTQISIFNPSANTFYNNSKRALDVYINGLLNNTISVDTLTNSKTDPDSPPYITYMDASMNYMTTNGNQIIVGDDSSTIVDGTISNAEFIKDGCSPQNVRDIFNQGESGSIFENLLSYKLRFSFIEDDKETKTYDFL